MKKLIYRKELPTTVGWYWVRWDSQDNWGETSDEVVFVRQYGKDLAIHNTPIAESPRCARAMWAGPIPHPTLR